MFVGLTFLGAGEHAELFVAKVFFLLDLTAWVACLEVRIAHEDTRALYLGKFFPWVEYFGHACPLFWLSK